MARHENRVAAVLLDLGGVLVELTGARRMIEITRGAYTEQQLWNKWLQSPAGRDFERGLISPSAFAERMAEEFGLSLPPSEFLDEFLTWAQKPFPGAETLLRRVAESGIALGCLTNTNRLHWEHLLKNTALLAPFTHLFPSHLTGFLKPSSEAFANAVAGMGCRPEDILFADDNPDNVAAAAAFGIRAFRVRGLTELAVLLSEHNLITKEHTR